jgi:ribokinase
VLDAESARPRIAVVGSVNLDLVARCERLPRPGETVSGASFDRVPGGKGANQAVAAARLGADVRFVGAVAVDDLADDALAGLEEAEVDTSGVKWISEPGMHTGVALIFVDTLGENEIVVSPGANAYVSPQEIDVADADAVICQLEIPDDAVYAAAQQARFFCLNAAPARPVDVEPDLLVVNRLEHEVSGDRGKLVAVTLGAEGAILLEDGEEVARAEPPSVRIVDGTAAGDAFTACLVVSLVEGRPRQQALNRACAAGALAASRRGAQPSLPTADEIDAILA